MKMKEKGKRGKRKARTFLFSMPSLFNLNASGKLMFLFKDMFDDTQHWVPKTINIAGFLFTFIHQKSKSDPCSVITITTQPEVSYYIVNPIRKYGGRPIV